MAKVKRGDKVRVKYKGSLEDGTVFNASFEKEPLEIVIGNGTVIAGFEDGITGMEQGEQRQIRISPEDAYGNYNRDLEFVIHGENMPQGVEPEIGTILQMAVGDGKVSNVAITCIEGNRITVDGNHPLAGKILVFDITDVEIVESA